MLRASVAILISVPVYLSAQLAPGSWRTDLSKHSVDFTELVTAGRKDSVKSVDQPKFVSSAEAGLWLNAKEPVIVVELNGEARAYPLQILIWHLLVNDRIGDTPIVVSYSVFAHSGIVYERRVGETVYDFGFAGMVRNSDFVMFDRQSDSLWQQLTGESIAGSLTGSTLKMLHSQIAPFEVFNQSFPNAKVLSRDTGFTRKYGENPYARYLADGRPRFPVKSARAMALPPMEQVITVQTGRGERAYPVSTLRDRHVVEDKIGGQKFVILSSDSMLNARDSPLIADSGKDMAVGVFSPVLNGKTLSFRYHAGAFIDKQTGSVWNVLGIATTGSLAGKHLAPVASRQAFAFAWMAFYPDTAMIAAPGPAVPEVAEPLDPSSNPDARRPVGVRPPSGSPITPP